ncbi:uncharacterized protein MONBRDRAFT_12899 [Monosiga brevicollis MX1]|uniref:Uncharacterized protein n=1 Tax=Monosiga brevicollis TaxID=81824 RepID=A9VDN6_MONBE|nr:uncharacterized protein MONBRDRAFT_12899 [Monosiga brevicollis MX1]EDQ84332.1 predicted protein [Monosiga brevicollis MX1]|eukprot:XP_001750828.1 hypothetical protein [Monosiga brevicollis MX1]
MEGTGDSSGGASSVGMGRAEGPKGLVAATYAEGAVGVKHLAALRSIELPFFAFRCLQLMPRFSESDHDRIYEALETAFGSPLLGAVDPILGDAADATEEASEDPLQVLLNGTLAQRLKAVSLLLADQNLPDLEARVLASDDVAATFALILAHGLSSMSPIKSSAALRPLMHAKCAHPTLSPLPRGGVDAELRLNNVQVLAALLTAGPRAHAMVLLMARNRALTLSELLEAIIPILVKNKNTQPAIVQLLCDLLALHPDQRAVVAYDLFLRHRSQQQQQQQQRPRAHPTTLCACPRDRFDPLERHFHPPPGPHWYTTRKFWPNTTIATRMIAEPGMPLLTFVPERWTQPLPLPDTMAQAHRLKQDLFTNTRHNDQEDRMRVLFLLATLIGGRSSLLVDADLLQQNLKHITAGEAQTGQTFAPILDFLIALNLNEYATIVKWCQQAFGAVAQVDLLQQHELLLRGTLGRRGRLHKTATRTAPVVSELDTELRRLEVEFVSKAFAARQIHAVDALVFPWIEQQVWFESHCGRITPALVKVLVQWSIMCVEPMGTPRSGHYQPPRMEHAAFCRRLQPLTVWPQTRLTKLASLNAVARACALLYALSVNDAISELRARGCAHHEGATNPALARREPYTLADLLALDVAAVYRQVRTQPQLAALRAPLLALIETRFSALASHDFALFVEPRPLSLTTRPKLSLPETLEDEGPVLHALQVVAAHGTLDDVGLLTRVAKWIKAHADEATSAVLQAFQEALLALKQRFHINLDLSSLLLPAWLPNATLIRAPEEDLSSDPLLFLHLAPAVLVRPPLLRLLLAALQTTLINHSQMLQGQADALAQQPQRKRRKPDEDVGEICKTLQWNTVAALLLFLWELPYAPGVRDAQERTALCHDIGLFTHRQLILHKDLLPQLMYCKLAFTTLPDFVEHVPAAHVAFDYLSELLGEADHVIQLGAVHLAALLAHKYRLPRALQLLNEALGQVPYLLVRASQRQATRLALERLCPCFRLMCEAFPRLRQACLDVLKQACTSLEDPFLAYEERTQLFAVLRQTGMELERDVLVPHDDAPFA